METSSPDPAARLRITCPHCLKAIKVPPEYLGRTAKCPGCEGKVLLQLPSPDATASAAPPAVAPVAMSPPSSRPPSGDATAITPSGVTRSFWRGVLVGGAIMGLAAAGGIPVYLYLKSGPAPMANQSSADGALDIADTEPPSSTRTAESHRAHADDEVVKYATPEECFRAFSAAGLQKDHGKMLSCMLEQERNIFVGNIAYALQREAHMSSAEALAAEVEGIFESHGIGGLDIMGGLQMASMSGGDGSIAKVFAQVGAKVRDQAKFLHDLDELEERLAAESGRNQMDEAERVVPELVDVEIEGNVATGTVDIKGRPPGLLLFWLADGGWLIGSPPKSATAATPRPRDAETESARDRPLPEQRTHSPRQRATLRMLDQYGVINEEVQPISESADVKVPEFTLADRAMQDVHLASIGQLPYLESVDLQDGRLISDMVLYHVSRLPRLRYLNLNGTGVSLTGFEYDIRLPHLKHLLVANTQVNDRIFAFAERCPELELLDVTNTRVTREGVERFRAAHLECEVVFEEDRPRPFR